MREIMKVKDSGDLRFATSSLASDFSGFYYYWQLLA